MNGPLNRTRRAAAVALSVVLAASTAGAAAAGAPAQQRDQFLPAERLTLKSATSVNLTKGFATLPLKRGLHGSTPVWYVITDVSDEGLARDLGVNFAPRLANLPNGCPGCVTTVQSPSRVLGRDTAAFPAAPDFGPSRVLVPGPTAFPPVIADAGSTAPSGYSDFVRVQGSDAVFNAPIVAVGDGPFDVTRHTNTLDRVMAIDTAKMTVDLLFIRAFSNGKDVFYLSFGASAPPTALFERGTVVPAIGQAPFAGASEHPQGARAAIFAFTNGQRGPASPPAQGLQHLIVDGRAQEDAHPGNTALLEALRLGGDSHNVLDFFPTLRDQRLARLYSPLWDLHLAQWSPDAVAQGLNVAQKDANGIRNLAARGLVSGAGGTPLGPANVTINCPVLGFADDPPDGVAPLLPEAKRAVDGLRLADLPPALQASFRAVWGDRAHERWIEEHDAELLRR